MADAEHPNRKADQALRLAAMNLLARREHSSAELKQKLMQKGWQAERIDLTLHRLQQEGLQNDARFVEHYIRYRAQRGFGPVKIQYELQQKGVDHALIQQHMQSWQSEWPERMRQVVVRKRKHVADFVSLSLEEQRKMQCFLRQRGFPPELVYQGYKLL